MAKSKSKQAWAVGDMFVVQQQDGVCSVGQILDATMTNVVACAFYDVRVSCIDAATPIELPIASLIAALAVSREQLDYGAWRIIGHQAVVLDRNLWPNEEFRESLWIGAKVYDASIVEEFLNAFNGLTAWDDWHDPEYLDKLLIAPDRKPKHLQYKKR